jgi:hypothetical protein
MIKFINLPRAICDHAIGGHHSVPHRLVAGSIIMCVGVGTAKAAVLFHFFPIHFGLDLVGYLIHGMGAVPFIELLVQDKRD